MKKFLIILLIIIIALSTAIYFLTKDAPPVEDEDLRITYEDIPKADNAFYDFEKAMEAMYFPDELREGGVTDEDMGFVKEVLDKNDEAFKYFYQGLEKEKFQIPEMTDGLAQEMPYLFEWREFALLNNVRSDYLYKIGKGNEAIEVDLANVEFGYRVQLAKGSLIHLMIGFVIQGIGLESITTNIDHMTIDKKTARRYIQSLKSCEDSREGLINAYKVEYVYLQVFTIDQAQNAINAWIKHSVKEKVPFASIDRLIETTDKIKFAQPLAIRYIFQPERTKRQMAEYVRQLINALSQNYYKDIAIEKAERLTYSLEGEAGRPFLIRAKNVVGKIYMALLLPGIDGAIHELDRLEAYTKLTEGLIALKSYKDTYGSLPDTLEKLVPEYFNRVPVDPYDGEPIRYDKAKRVIYRVGKDLEEDELDAEEWNKIELSFD